MASDVPSIVTSYLDTYLNPAPVQEPAASGTDPQLSSLTTTISDRMQRIGSRGILLDIGCGKGSFLQRLVEDEIFNSRSEWIYVAVDSDEHLDVVHRISRDAKITRKVEPVTLDEFYQNWPVFELPQIVFCRNVFHELTIKQTAQLLSHIVANLRVGDVLICQDLMTFPQGERHNACWFPEEFKLCMNDHGFDQVTVVPLSSRSGSYWFNVIAERSRTGGALLLPDNSLKSVMNARLRQWNAWSEIDSVIFNDKPDWSKVKTMLDLDLQLAALTRQLKDVGAIIGLSPEIEKRVRRHEINDAITAFIEQGVLTKTVVPEINRFRERGEQLNILEEFLRGGATLAAVTGGGGIGKTTLVEHVLTNRSYTKSVIIIDAKCATSLWSFIEILFTGVGLKFSAERLAALETLDWSALEIPLRQFANKLSSKFILFIDNFDVLTDTNGAIEDRDIALALTILIGADGAKTIIAQRNSQLPKQLIMASRNLNPCIVNLRRYAAEQTVVNILDDHFDRANANLDAYPQRLLKAIDRHPLAAKLASEILRKNGISVLDDERFHLELERHLYRELWSRLVDQYSEAAIQMACNLRTPVPRRMLDALSSNAEVSAGLASAALYGFKDRRWDELVATLGIFRDRVDSNPMVVLEQNESDKKKHARIADNYLSVYREDDDPKWLRESYFHRILGSDGANRITLGPYYFRELISSADYCFKKQRDYSAALELYQSAAKLNELTEEVKMHAASCQIRLGKRPAGDHDFENLVQRYPSNMGIRTSYIDALLYIRDFTGAQKKLNEYGLTPSTSDWIVGQWGRMWLGINDYKQAELMFRKQLVSNEAPDFQVFLNLARALQSQGAVTEALDILKQGEKLHLSNVSIAVAIGACLEHLRSDDEALALLEPIFDAHPDRTSAALTIIKILGKRGNNAAKARRIFERAKKFITSSASSQLVTIEAELLKIENNPEGAVQLLLKQEVKDQHILGMLFECWYHFALTKSTSEERRSIALEALAVDVPKSLLKNIPLIINLCRLARLANDRPLFDSLYSEIKSTRVETFEVQNLESLWHPNE